MKLIGSGGKARKQPSESQRKFTVGGIAVTPTQVAGFKGDIRYQLTETEVDDLWVHGHYMTEFRNLRRKTPLRGTKTGRGST